jgi:hypothetical protein
MEQNTKKGDPRRQQKSHRDTDGDPGRQLNSWRDTERCSRKKINKGRRETNSRKTTEFLPRDGPGRQLNYL